MNARGREYSGENNRRLSGRLTLATRAAVKNEGKEAGQTFGTDQKPIKFRRDPRAVDSPVHEIAIRFHADFDTLPSRRSAPRSRSALSSLSHPATPSGFSSRTPRWARLLRNGNSKAPASERADLFLGPGSYLHYVRDKGRESLATAAQ